MMVFWKICWEFGLMRKCGKVIWKCFLFADMNGTFGSSLFQLPTYTTASSSSTTATSTKSTFSSSKSDKHSSSHKSSSSSSSSKTDNHRASLSKSTSSSSTSPKHKEGSHSSKPSSSGHSDSGSDVTSPKVKNGPSSMSMSKYDEEVAKSLGSLFSFPDSTAAMLAPSMFAAPPIFSYPFSAGALFAAHHASLFGTQLSPSHHSMPFTIATTSPPVSAHSTNSPKSSSSSRGAVTKTTVSTATTPSVVPTATSNSISNRSSTDHESRKRRKKLFTSKDEPPLLTTMSAPTSDFLASSRFDGAPKLDKVYNKHKTKSSHVRCLLTSLTLSQLNHSGEVCSLFFSIFWLKIVMIESESYVNLVVIVL